MQAKYVVASKKNRTVRSFDRAEQVATFMLGRDFNDWVIYQRQDDLFVERADITQIQRMLEARESLKANNIEAKYDVTSQMFQDGRDAHHKANSAETK